MQPLWEACAATVRTAPLDSGGFVLCLPTPAFWKNYLLRMTFGATVDSFGYKKHPHDSMDWQFSSFVSALIKPAYPVE
jgi:hypothetical protein